ncbi:MAG: hypothetical protein MK212_12275, partial [Saprospiraceae bacterium]|nr:hypothetical protein [Saprospiraceae bacterium]
MSNYAYLFTIFIGIICLTSLSSCRKDHGHTHPPYNPPLYDARDQFVGNYDVWEITTNPTTQESDTAFYEMSIYKANNDKDVILEALDGVGIYFTGGCTVTGIVGGDRINIPVNLCDFQNGLFYKFTGDG